MRISVRVGVDELALTDTTARLSVDGVLKQRMAVTRDERERFTKLACAILDADPTTLVQRNSCNIRGIEAYVTVSDGTQEASFHVGTNDHVVGELHALNLEFNRFYDKFLSGQAVE
jgi:hypothetical protein